MRVLIRGYVIFICLTGYIFGQLFFGEFTFDTTIIAVGGITASIMWNEHNLGLFNKAVIIFLVTLVTLILCAYETYYYYEYLNIPGNNFAWPMRGAFYLALVIIFLSSALHLTNHSSRDRRPDGPPAT